jgi:TPR repeat protein
MPGNFLAAAALLTIALFVGDNSAFAAGKANPDSYQRGDLAAAARDFAIRAERGERLAQFNLAMMMFRGEAAGEREMAISWLRKAAVQGLPQAQYNLGLLYENGAGLPRSQTDATAWFRRAAEQGHTDAQLSLATQYMLGRGAPKDFAEAAIWYERAAEGDDVAAQYIIASFYEHGDGVKQDLRRARHWYEQAARQGDPLARGKVEEVGRKLAEQEGVR